MNLPTLGEGDGDGSADRPSYNTESPAPTRISPSDSTVNLPVLPRGTASTELVRVAPAPVELPQVETAADGSARTGTVFTGELQLAVNAPDGSTAADCPPGLRPQVTTMPADPTVRPRVASGLLERDALCERLRGLLLQGRSVRLIGPQGSGRSAILDAVATACSGLAPAGVVRLTGYARTSGDLLQDLFSATHQAPGYRPGRVQLPELLRELCAIVVIDDVEFSGETLEELLAVAPESSFLITSTTATATPLSANSKVGARLEDTRLPGLSRQSSLALLARLAGRSLDETERAWAVDLWFESEGLPLRFVQAAALLRHRESAIEAMAAGVPGPEWAGPAAIEAAPFQPTVPRGDLSPARQQPTPGGFEAYLSQHGRDDEAPLVDPVPLPSVAESAAPAVRISRGLSQGARRTLGLATALGGEIPSAPHLPALIDVGHGEEALEELVAAGLATPVGTRHHRLVGGVAQLLADEWPGADSAHNAAQHFAWWTGHASVTEEQIAAEAEVLLAVMHADREHGRHHQVVLLARACAPAFALGLRWGAWERSLRFGLESARATAAVAEEAWFHHELGVLALCVGAHDRSRAELEASVALRGALGDSRGTASGRRALRQLDHVGTLLPGRTVVLAGRNGPGIGGLRRVLPFRRTDEPGATRRQIVLAVVGVVLMGVLGAAVALGVGAFGKVGAGTGMTVAPAVGDTGAADPGSSSDPVPTATDSGAAAPAGSPSSTASPSGPGGGSADPGGQQSDPGGQGTGPTSPSLSPSPTITMPPTHGGTPSKTPKPTHTNSTPPPTSVSPTPTDTPTPTPSDSSSSGPVTGSASAPLPSQSGSPVSPIV
ncbi:ATP-binding protein [Streptacidiphilus sp. N1-3]|uniref:ATP-binding protein n=1 Tax=Streptacidiphilus alkalitolerans TaxID=3342712 RepID=A0ABV6WVY5_9ACTN